MSTPNTQTLPDALQFIETWLDGLSNGEATVLGLAIPATFAVLVYMWKQTRQAVTPVSPTTKPVSNDDIKEIETMPIPELDEIDEGRRKDLLAMLSELYKDYDYETRTNEKMRLKREIDKIKRELEGLGTEPQWSVMEREKIQRKPLKKSR